MHIGIVVGEASGDILGAGLIQALKKRFPQCRFSGIGGDLMLNEGFESLYPQERLAVMGLLEPLKRLPELLRIRKHLYQHFVSDQVDVVVGIDSPDFNLHLEKKLRHNNIATVHYVSPSVWAWRQGRIKTIKKSVDWMLTLLPFEAIFYEQHNVPVTFVGHPIADKFPIKNDTQEARHQLSDLIGNQISNGEQKTLIACLPGSRSTEVEYIGPAMWQAMFELVAQKPDTEIVVPALNASRRLQIEKQLELFPSLPVHLIDGHSKIAMSAADCVVMASGTTTLEAMLLKKPMVVVYKKDAFSYGIISRMLKAKFISLPNLLANEELVPELLQNAATPDAIVQGVLSWLENPSAVNTLQQKFTELHQLLRLDANELAADVIENLLKERA